MIYDGKTVKELQGQATSIKRMIVKLHEKPANQHCGGFVNALFCGMIQLSSEDTEFHEEKLKELCQRIRLQQCEIHLKEKEFTAAFVSFKSRLGATLAAETQQHAHPLLWVTESAPEPNEVIWKNVSLPYRYLAIQTIAVIFAAAVLTIFFALPVTAVQGIVQFEKIQKWFPPAMAVQLIPGLTSILTGYLPSAILNLFIYVVPYMMLALASLGGCVSKSKQEIKSCSMVFYFLLGNVFFLSLLSGSLLNQIGESFTHLKDFPSHLASAVSSQMQDVYATVYDTHGQYWPCIHHYIIVTIVLMQITMIGLFGLKSKPAASISTVVLVLITVLFNEHCKLRFLPSFRHLPIQIAKEMDDEEEFDGQMQVNHAAAINAYQPPWMRPVNFQASTSTEPLIEA